jgi:hypothetical protein
VRRCGPGSAAPWRETGGLPPGPDDPWGSINPIKYKPRGAKNQDGSDWEIMDNGRLYEWMKEQFIIIVRLYVGGGQFFGRRQFRHVDKIIICK